MCHRGCSCCCWGNCMQGTEAPEQTEALLGGNGLHTWGVGGAGAQSIGAVAFAFLASSNRAPACEPDPLTESPTRLNVIMMQHHRLPPAWPNMF